MKSADSIQNSPSLGVRLFFGLGQLPEGIKSSAFGFFLLFYYNQVLGLSGTLSGAAIFIALLFDAISDPLVGSLSDATRSRWGRRHPYMYASAIPFGVSFYLLFSPMDGLSEYGLFAWLAVFAVLTRTFMTFYSVPHMSLGAELTRDYDDRTNISALRNVFGIVGVFLVLIGGPLFYFAPTDEYANGQLNPTAYSPFAFAAGLVMVAGVWLSAAGTHRQIPYLPQAAPGSHFSLTALLRDLTRALKIRSFLAMMTATIVGGMTHGMVQALIIYTGTYFFELSTSELTMVFAAGVFGVLCGSLLVKGLSAYIKEKREIYIFGQVWYAFFYSSIVILRLLDLIPANDSPIVAPLYIVSVFLGGIGLGLANPVGVSMIADITDEHELKHGQRQEGIYFAAVSFAGKAIGGSGAILAGLIIDFAGIPSGASPSSVSPDAIVRFGWALGPGVIVLTGLVIICIRFYTISRQRHHEILAEINARDNFVGSEVA